MPKMHYLGIIALLIPTLSLTSSHPTTTTLTDAPNPNIPASLFAELEELSRIVDISYCVGTTGIAYPFECVSRCHEFPAFELVGTFNTGPLMSDSCGFVVLDHGMGRGGGSGRIVVAFRGTYSLANTIVDLSTVPQEYVPYPGSPGNGSGSGGKPKEGKRGGKHWFWDWFSGVRDLRSRGGGKMSEGLDDGGLQSNEEKEKVKCENCAVHTGFWTSWQNTRPFILPHLEAARKQYPNYTLDLVGHSLGGAVAALAGLELDALGWEPTVTTFGEPKVGNSGLRNFIDRTFDLPSGNNSTGMELHCGRYRRITHVDDPVPLLPLQEWGYRSHAGEVFISKSSLQPSLLDLRLCYGDEDLDCIYGAEVDASWSHGGQFSTEEEVSMSAYEADLVHKRWGIPIPARYKMWQLFFAHRDYFWRLGLCVSGGDPTDWGRDKYRFGEGDDENGIGKEEL